MRLGGELFAEGAATEAVAVFEQLKSSATGPQVSAECGRVLVDFEQYDLARPFLERALASEPGLSTARLDLAIVKCGNSRGFQDVDLVAAQGNGGQKIYVVPEYKLIAVFTGGGYNAESTPPNTIMAKVTLPRLMQAVNSGKASSPDK